MKGCGGVLRGRFGWMKLLLGLWNNCLGLWNNWLGILNNWLGGCFGIDADLCYLVWMEGAREFFRGCNDRGFGMLFMVSCIFGILRTPRNLWVNSGIFNYCCLTRIFHIMLKFIWHSFYLNSNLMCNLVHFVDLLSNSEPKCYVKNFIWSFSFQCFCEFFTPVPFFVFRKLNPEISPYL